MPRIQKVAMGRPMSPRERKGYQIDLEHLARLRRATFADDRLTTREYEKVCHATFVIENVLRHLAKGKKKRA